MGTIIIEEWAEVGGSNQAGAPVYRNLQNTTVDSTTSSSAETIASSGSAGYLSIYAVEAHRVSIGADDTAGDYVYIAAGERRDIGLQAGGQDVYYRTDA